MARFARDSINKMHEVTRKLEVVLGPDTADLDFRIGLHSGPVSHSALMLCLFHPSFAFSIVSLTRGFFPHFSIGHRWCAPW